MSEYTDHQVDDQQTARPVEPATSSAKNMAWQDIAAAPVATATFVGDDLAEEDWLKPAS